MSGRKNGINIFDATKETGTIADDDNAVGGLLKTPKNKTHLALRKRDLQGAQER